MKKVKISAIGLIDMLYFKNKYKEREKMIQDAEAHLPNATPITNRKAAERHPDSQQFVIAEVIERGRDVKTYVLRKKDGSMPAPFRAGQYLVLRQIIDGKLIARPVSLSCGSGDVYDHNTCSVTVKRVPDGFMSEYILNNWQVGTEVTTSGPQGTFYYEGIRDSANVIAVAGGSGITPILSMASAIASGDEDFNLTILYGCRTRSDILFADESASICSHTDKVKLINVLSEEQAEGYEYGFINKELIKKYAGDGQFSVFAAGPQAMYRFLDDEIAKLGLPQKFYRKEIFGASKTPWMYPEYPVNIRDKVFNAHVIICDKEYDVPCRADETILTAFERAGVAGPNRCRGGVCGWCRSKLLSGEVFIPEDTDGRRAADKVYGYIHPCASFPLTDLTIEVPFNK